MSSLRCSTDPPRPRRGSYFVRETITRSGVGWFSFLGDQVCTTSRQGCLGHARKARRSSSVTRNTPNPRIVLTAAVASLVLVLALVPAALADKGGNGGGKASGGGGSATTPSGKTSTSGCTVSAPR